MVGRFLASELCNRARKAFIVENKVGATGTSGNAFVKRTAPDGNNLLVAYIAQFALGPPNECVLHFSLKQGQSATQKTLAEKAGVEQPSMAQLLTRIERDGLVCREVYSGDRRCSLIRLTDEALSRLEAGKNALKQIDSEVCAEPAAQARCHRARHNLSSGTGRPLSRLSLGHYLGPRFPGGHRGDHMPDLSYRRNRGRQRPGVGRPTDRRSDCRRVISANERSGPLSARGAIGLQCNASLFLTIARIREMVARIWQVEHSLWWIPRLTEVGSTTFWRGMHITVRAARPGEVCGRCLRFVNDATFIDLDTRCDFIEMNKLGTRRYSLSKQALTEAARWRRPRTKVPP